MKLLFSHGLMISRILAVWFLHYECYIFLSIVILPGCRVEYWLKEYKIGIAAKFLWPSGSNLLL